MVFLKSTAEIIFSPDTQHFQKYPFVDPYLSLFFPALFKYAANIKLQPCSLRCVFFNSTVALGAACVTEVGKTSRLRRPVKLSTQSHPVKII